MDPASTLSGEAEPSTCVGHDATDLEVGGGTLRANWRREEAPDILEAVTSMRAD